MRLRRVSLLFGFAFLSASLGYSQGPSFEWVVQAGAATTFSGGYGIANDATGNVYVTGRFTGTVDFDPGAGTANLTSAGALDTYITKVDAGGNLVWARRVGGTLDDYSFDLFIDNSGNVYVTGSFVGTADFDPGAGTFNLSSAGLFEDIFVLKLDLNGDLAWARKMGSSDFDFGQSITVSAAGNVFTTGRFRGTVDFDPGPGTSFLTSVAGQNDIFISKLDAAGNFVWAKRLGGTGNDIGYAVTVDAAENIFTTGSFSATADFDPGPSNFDMTAVGNNDIFISKLDAAGNFVWAKSMGGTSSDVGHGIQVDDSGNVYTTGFFHTTVDFDPGPGTASLVSAGFNDAFICKLDVNGNYLWAKGMGGTSDEESSGLALDDSGNVYATGSFESTVDFDPGPGTFILTPSGSEGFVVKLDASGDFEWAQAFSTRPEGIDVGSDGSIYTTGYFGGTVDFDTGPGVYNVTAAGSNDTFIHKMSQVPPPPTITSFTPSSGPIGTTVTISGINFSATPANNIVYFGAVRASVTGATSTQLTVTVPTGATFKPITVSVNGLIAYASNPFVVTFAGGTPIDNCSFAPAIAIGTVSTSSFSTALCDLDGDGKIDLLIPELASDQLTIYRNTSISGTPSFTPKIPFTGLTGAISVAAGDLDGDGKPDIAVANYTDGQLSVYKNLSIPGNISLATRVTYSIPAFTSEVSIADIDGDGKQDLIISASIQGLIVMRNQGISGVIDASTFAAGVTFATGANAYPVALGDLDGDGKLDAVVPNANTYTLSLLRNTSTPGVVSFAASVTLTTNTGTPTAGYGTGYVSLGDIDGDSKLDIAAVSNTVTKLSLFRNTSTPGSLTFDPRFDIATTGIGAAPPLSDLNGDGKLDLVADNGPLQIVVFESIASSGAIDATTFKTPVIIPRASSYTTQLGDVDGDGRNDIISTSTNVQVFRNLVGTISPPTLTSFSPLLGTVGSSVTITGTNLISPFPTTVFFNGTSATITGSNATTLIATVPIGATTGPIEVTTGCNTILSSGNFTIGPPSTISITTQPSGVAVCEGTIASFTTAATGTTNITYQWQYSTTLAGTYSDIANGSGYSNVTTTSLSVSTSGNFGAGFYRCKINGDFAITVFSNAIELAFNATPVAPLVTPASSCVAGVLTLIATGGTNGQYRWYDVATGGTAILGEVNDSYTTPVISTTTTYYVAINDGTCESLRAPAVAQINSIPASPATTNGSSCGAAAVTLSASGATNGEYRWYNVATGGTALVGEVNDTYTTPVISITTTYYVAINNGACEGSRASVLATVDSPPAQPTIALSGAASFCQGGSVTLSASVASSYLWSSGETTQQITVSTAGTFSVSVGDANGCSSPISDPVTLTVNALPAKPLVNASGATTLCEGGSVVLSAPAGFSYAWSNGVTTEQNTVTSSGNYSVSITDSNGCSSVASDPVSVTVNPLPAKPVITPSGSTTLCSGQSVTLSAPAGFVYTWSTGATTQAITVATSGTYSLTVTNNNACTSVASDPVSVVVSNCNQPPVIATTNQQTGAGGSLTVSLVELLSDPDNNLDLTTLKIVGMPVSGAIASINASFELELDYDGILFVGTDIITIEVCDDQGVCTQQQISIEVASDVVVMNGISPNGDGANDFFEIRYIDAIPATQQNRVTIFNRWGDEVFESTDYDNKTNVFTGLSKNGGELPSGTYFYKIVFFGGHSPLAGNLTLKRN